MNQECPFDFVGRVVLVTGARAVLCCAVAQALARQGAAVVVVGHTNMAKARGVVRQIAALGGRAIAVQADVLSKESLISLAQKTADTFGPVDILVNGAGGATQEATTSQTLSFFDLSEEAVRWVFYLNFMGAFLACQVFGRHMAEQGRGSILNIGSTGVYRPLTRSVACSAAKAAVINFTQWLAVHMSEEYTPDIRVNALVPGFLLTEQNGFLLINDQNSELTERGQRILAHTPMKRFGQPEDLTGPALMLLSDVASFVQGASVVVDGGLSAYGGV